MPTKDQLQTMQTLEVIKHERIAASIDIVFETVLEQMGPLCGGPDDINLSLRLEPWPGGRWYRDLGNNAGHLWGHVQAIRPPTLLELCGPMFMSAPVITNVQYRLSEENGITLLDFTHRSAGWIPEQYLDGSGVNKGWSNVIEHIVKTSEMRQKAAPNGNGRKPK